ncbi:hypothetical protein CHCC14427_1775 [Bacillus paralicheniformis]|nr:hypothetical protein CHCC14427_1775 [Bacillus paralicheniformis]
MLPFHVLCSPFILWIIEVLPAFFLISKLSKARLVSVKM